MKLQERESKDSLFFWLNGQSIHEIVLNEVHFTYNF